MYVSSAFMASPSGSIFTPSLGFSMLQLIMSRSVANLLICSWNLKKLGVTLSKTGMACAMCHPFGSDNHPYEFPKFQGQINKFATLRDMINWCIEKPNEGVKIDPDGDAMKALETYIYWSNKGSKLDPGRH